MTGKRIGRGWRKERDVTDIWKGACLGSGRGDVTVRRDVTGRDVTAVRDVTGRDVTAVRDVTGM